MYGDLKSAHGKSLPGVVEPVDWWLGLDAQTEHLALLLHRAIQEIVVAMQPGVDLECSLGLRNAGDVIQVRVCEQDGLYGHSLRGRACDELIHFVARVDEHSGVGPFAGHEVSVLHEGRDGGREDAHRLDDIIRSADDFRR